MELDEGEHEGHAACPYCGKTLDVHREIVLERKGPKPGDLTICWGCVGICVFTEDMNLRLPTDEEFSEVIRIARPIQALVHKMKAGQ